MKNVIHSGIRFLITGACGSIGTALVRRLLNDGHIVCAFDQNEDALFKLDQEFMGKVEKRLKLFIGNIRNKNSLRHAMEGVHVVFHCAALKHVYLSEYNAIEAILTNVEGTQNVIESAISANVKKVILTSSDKAVNPTSTMGATKLLGERLFIAANHIDDCKTRFSCVRFGNVINSNGSILQIFQRQIKHKLPLTITSKDMTRFFISIDQSVELCLHAMEEMIGGEIFVRTMGSSNIMTLAKVINGNIQFEHVIIGHKPGEKLYEELVTESEISRTVMCNGDIYVILPDTINMMSNKIRKKYTKYEKLPRLLVPLRSDLNLMSENDVAIMLKSAEYSLKKTIIIQEKLLKAKQ